ncbi:MAG: amidohydrolase family protein [Proteobacteria bacterium]|nr:amidohydrolase family protein [Pseudomonadota bacterium]
MYNGNLIDFHTHVFPDKLYEAIKNWFVKNVGWEFYFKGSSRDVLNFLENNSRIAKYICFGYAHKPNISDDLNKFYGSLSKIYKKAIPLGCFHQEDDNLVSVIKKAFSYGLIGFKLHCQVQKVSPNDERLYKVYETVIENQGFILFHAGTGPFPNEFVGFKKFEGVLKKFPKLKCVVAHLGAFEEKEFLEASLYYENLYLDTSYTFIANPTNIMSAPIELIKKASHKIFFGSDFPGICHSYERSVQVIEELSLTEEEKNNIFFKNANSFINCLMEFRMLKRL